MEASRFGKRLARVSKGVLPRSKRAFPDRNQKNRGVGFDGRQPKGLQQTDAGKPRKRRLSNYDAPHASESSLDRLFCPTRFGYSFSSTGEKGTRGGATTTKDRDGECRDDR